MTAFTDIPTDASIAEAPHMVNGTRWLKRAAQRMSGVTLVLASIGLWVTPGALWGTDMALIKLGISLFLGFSGLAIIHAGRAQRSVEVEIDTVRREVRLVRGKGRERSLVSRTSISDLGPAEMHGNMVRLWAPDGALVAEVAMIDPNVRRSLTSALRDAGKL